MPLPIVQVDAFTPRPFAGNPAAVCVLPAPRPDEWLQGVALEMNLSETAFLEKQDDVFQLRWFTPLQEVDLCGHATLASAHVLWEDGHLPAGQPARFQTRSGPLSAERQGDWIIMDFPAEPAAAISPPPDLAAALGVNPVFVGKNRFDILLLVETEEEVRRCRPDFAMLKKIGGRGVILTARSDDSGHDFVSRFFAPAAGVDEDPVTGSAHCCLGPFWSERLGKEEVIGFQASARSGVVRVRVAGPRVRLGGQAVTVLRGELLA